MTQQAADQLSLRDAFRHLGDLPISRRRFQNIALFRLAIAIPFAVLPTQLYMRQMLQFGWNPQFATWPVNIHLVALVLYLVLSCTLAWVARAGGDLRALRGLNRLSIGAELITNQAYLVAFGNLDNYSVSFLILLVVMYRLLFDYRTALLTLVVGVCLYVPFALCEIYALLPAASLFPLQASHPIRSDPKLWPQVIISVPLVASLAFTVANYGMNQSYKLHNYVTRSVLQRYLPTALVDRAARGELQLDAAPRRRTVTIMFTDIVGFTGLSERLGPEAIGDLLNRLLGEIATLALEHGATVDKFIGDCVMVVFGAPEDCPPEQQVERCVALALEVHSKVMEIGAEQQLTARTGINTGEVVVGNFGSAARSDYTVLGPAVNIAARLEANSKPGRILIGPESARLLGDKTALESAGQLELKGVSEPIHGWF
ncbi:MAG TPA: hypothetical protein DIU15_20810, partial [Deltaproteobacteria bacterium]|nr:hypothetical protein [Deltaproteobacteria bacterium]